jgi:hypothetical protein
MDRQAVSQAKDTSASLDAVHIAQVFDLEGGRFPGETFRQHWSGLLCAACFEWSIFVTVLRCGSLLTQ